MAPSAIKTLFRCNLAPNMRQIARVVDGRAFLHNAQLERCVTSRNNGSQWNVVPDDTSQWFAIKRVAHIRFWRQKARCTLKSSDLFIFQSNSDSFLSKSSEDRFSRHIISCRAFICNMTSAPCMEYRSWPG